MADHYTDVEVVGWGEKFSSSLLGVILGLILFIGSFFLLYWNEGRLNLSEIAKHATEISATLPNQQAVGKFISTTGTITSNQSLGDNQFLLSGQYGIIDRTVEMFSWKESSETRTEKHLNGSETRTTTYNYTKEWTDSPENSKNFKHSAGHENPQKAVLDQLYTVSSAKVGVYNINMADFKQVVQRKTSCDSNVTTFSYPTGRGIYLSDSSRLQLSPQLIKSNDNIKLQNNYLFKGNGIPENPNIGDLRICYNTIPTNSTVTVFGKLEASNQITPYNAPKNTKFYQLFASNRSDAITLLNSEYTVWIWVLRVLGFMAMFIGILLSLKPLNALIDLIPFVGGFFEEVTAGLSFFVAFVLTTVTILISQLLHHPLVLIASIVITFITLSIFRRFQKSV
jgi:Transmembrane protein 43